MERAGAPDGVGDLHRARITAIAPAMAGAFLALGGGETGFLPEKEAGGDGSPRQVLQEGRILPVRVIRAAQGGKGPRVSARLSPEEAARAAAAAQRTAEPPRGCWRADRRRRCAWPAPIPAQRSRRTARTSPCASAPRSAPTASRSEQQRRPSTTRWKRSGKPSPARARRCRAAGACWCSRPPALTAIDVDAGSVAGARDRQAQARFNAAAVAEAARQIRLRNLAGPLLLDVAGLSRRERERLAGPLARALAPDPLTRLLGLGPLGLFEMQRRRVHPPLHEVLGSPPSPLTHGLAALRRAAREAAASPGRALALRAAPAVVSALGRRAGSAARDGRSRRPPAAPPRRPDAFAGQRGAGGDQRMA